MARRAVNGANGVEGAGGPGSCERQLPKSAKTDLLTQGSEVQSLSLAQVLNLTNHSRERRDRITNHFSLLLCAFESLGEIAFISVYLRPLGFVLPSLVAARTHLASRLMSKERMLGSLDVLREPDNVSRINFNHLRVEMLAQTQSIVEFGTATKSMRHLEAAGGVLEMAVGKIWDRVMIILCRRRLAAG